MTASTVHLGIGPLSIDDVVAIARHGAIVTLAEDALAQVRHTRGVIEALADDVEPHYGVSTGFGAAGSGPEVEREVVRALMALRISTLATGRTGVRESTLTAYLALLNAGITPVVHEYGSLGCSGDLAPLAHCALALMGEGMVRDASGTLMPTADALKAAGLAPIELAEKEGLALINGTDGMLGMLCLAIADLRALLRTADIAAAMSIEGLLGTDDVLAADLHALRPQPGQAISAANMRMVLSGSTIRASHDTEDCPRVQDAYSLRCAPIVHGAARDTVEHAVRVADYELASAVDNPVVTLDGRVESNGNFHGAPVAYVLDFLAIVAADVASMAERRTDRFLDKARNHGLPPFLADDPGVDSGHMIAQYTQAAIVSELKRLAAPASVGGRHRGSHGCSGPAAALSAAASRGHRCCRGVVGSPGRRPTRSRPLARPGNRRSPPAHRRWQRPGGSRTSEWTLGLGPCLECETVCRPPTFPGRWQNR